MNINLKVKIAAVIVTYNRKKMLDYCLGAIMDQTRRVDSIIIVDNASTDCTRDYLKERGYLNNPLIDYVLLPENTGGAGGFYEGMKKAFDRGFEWFWLMDDDGIPATNCLSNLLRAYYANNADMLCSLVVDMRNERELSFILENENRQKITNIQMAKELFKNGTLEGFANLFNGALISRNMIKKIGYPKKEMFTWGDEVEYFYRIKGNKFKICTVENAIHKHPKNDNEEKEIFFNKYKISISNNKLKNYCVFRNYTYIYLHYKLKGFLIKSVLKYLWFFIVTSKMDLRGLAFYLMAAYHGLSNNFSRHKVYLD